jgi:hypothetical protein
MAAGERDIFVIGSLHVKSITGLLWFGDRGEKALGG